MNVVKGQTAPAGHRSARLQELPWNEINEPGCYLVIGSGNLVRIPSDAIAPGHSPLITISSNGETRVAKISDNPATPISTLRAIAADNDYFVQF
jgi:hypothetical protein